MSEGNRGSSPGEAKLAQQVADQIERQIMLDRWPVGEVLGSEAELLDRFGTSRAVLREAIRILEDHGVARMRKGRGGGLVVRRPEVAALARAAALHLDYEQVTSEQIFEARVGVELMAVRLAVQRCDGGAQAALREHLRQERVTLEDTQQAINGHHFHLLVATLSQNGALRLFTEMLMDLQLSRQRSNPCGPAVTAAVARRGVREHASIVDAIVSGDEELACQRMLEHLAGLSPPVRQPRRGVAS